MRFSTAPEAFSSPNSPTMRSASTAAPRAESRRKRRSSPKTRGSAAGRCSCTRRQASVPPYRSNPRVESSTANSSSRPSIPMARPSSWNTPRCTTSSPTRTARPPFSAGPVRPGGRFQVPSANCTRAMRGETARTRPRRSSRPVTDTPPPIVSSAADNSGSPPIRGSFSMRTSASWIDGGKTWKSTRRKVTGRFRSSESRCSDTPCRSVWKRSEFQIEYAASTTKTARIRKRREAESSCASCGVSSRPSPAPSSDIRRNYTPQESLPAS